MKANKKPSSTKLLTIKEFCERTSISIRTFYRMLEKGEFTPEDSYMIGFRKKHRVITEDWVNRFIESQKNAC